MLQFTRWTIAEEKKEILLCRYLFFCQVRFCTTKTIGIKISKFRAKRIGDMSPSFLKSIGEPIPIAETVVTIKDRLKNFLWSYIYI